MKTIQLVSIDYEDAVIADYKDFFRCDNPADYPRVVNSGEFVMNSLTDFEDIPVQRIVSHGQEFYVAVKNKVWEYLYLLTNPVTAESQENKIKNLKKNGDLWYFEANRCMDSLNTIKRLVFSASLLKRIKWVFTGVKL